MKLMVKELQETDGYVRTSRERGGRVGRGERVERGEREEEIDWEVTNNDIQVFRNRKARVAKFSQHSMEQLNPSQTPVEYLQSRFKNGSESAILRHLGRFGICGPIALHKIGMWRRGERREEGRRAEKRRALCLP